MRAPKTRNKFQSELRQWRGSKSQSVAAALLDVHPATYKNWEYGRNEPSNVAKTGIFHLMKRVG